VVLWSSWVKGTGKEVEDQISSYFFFSTGRIPASVKKERLAQLIGGKQSEIRLPN